jgi:hypothetical protein
LFENGRPLLEIDDLGPSEKILSDRLHHEETVRRLMDSGMAPVDDGWNGWLGRYQAALRRMALSVEERRRSKVAEHYRGRDRGR